MAPNRSNETKSKLANVVSAAKLNISKSTLTRNTLSIMNSKKASLRDLSKRKAENLSPPKGNNTKRSAFGDLTNAAVKNEPGKKTGTTKKALSIMTNTTNTKQANVKHKEIVKIINTASVKNAVLVNIKNKTVSLKDIENIPPEQTKGLSSTINEKRSVKKETKLDSLSELTSNIKQDKSEEKPKVVSTQKNSTTLTKDKVEVKVEKPKYDSIHKLSSSAVLSTTFRKSLDAPQDKSDDSSLYTSALENVSSSHDDSLQILTPVRKIVICGKTKYEEPPPGVVDFDKENLHDPVQVSQYAMDIFNYLKGRESLFRVQDYMSRQVLISKWMRCLLVDWMVEVQENFELNHETLYLGVKLTDMYLNKVVVGKEVLQLVGAVAIFLASKYDERMPPLVDDFLYLCENAFSREDFLKMEMDVFKVVGYDLGMPISYRFLRRYARCCKATMPTLTLARYILELSLMEYQFIFESESRLACAALYLALKMKKISDWTRTLEYYSGYKIKDFKRISLELNAMLHRKPKEQIKTVRNKYSHSIFFEVAKIPLIEDSDL